MAQSEVASLQKINVIVDDRYLEVEELFNKFMKASCVLLSSNMGPLVGSNPRDPTANRRSNTPKSTELLKFHEITKEIQELREKCQNFQEGSGEKSREFKILEETGLNIQLRLDDMKVDGEQVLKKQRREGIREVDFILRELAKKAYK